MTKIPSFSLECEKFLSKARQEGKRIVFTNGCFDILHSGHVTYLNEAKALGDYLFVGLNADESVQRLKGPTRPINVEKQRKYILENLKAVDFVEIFTEDTPLQLIEYVRPHILVKGGDYRIDNIVGADFVLSLGGQVQSLALVKGQSTTRIVDKINQTKNT